MEIFKELVKIENSCLGLGFFDGVHTGHRALIRELIKISKQSNKKSVIITFKKNPAEKFIKEKLTYLTTNEEKEKLLSKIGIDCLVELDFDDKLMNMTAENYIEEILYKNFKPKYIISGFNHTFGKNKCGTPNVLKKLEKEFNYKYIEMPPVKINNEIISSTLIKKELAKGNLAKANEMLDSPFSISGTVIEGNRLGRKIGFPTANIEYPIQKTKIPFGVYYTNVTVDNQKYIGMLNYGIKPTINKECKPVAEVHIIGFNKDIYGEELTIEILDKIRDEQKFGSIEELKQQITEDVTKCSKL